MLSVFENFVEEISSESTFPMLSPSSVIKSLRGSKSYGLPVLDFFRITDSMEVSLERKPCPTSVMFQSTMMTRTRPTPLGLVDLQLRRVWGMGFNHLNLVYFVNRDLDVTFGIGRFLLGR